MQSDHLEKICVLVEDLELKGFSPILVGGMALVILGSQRVTKDFDFLISLQESTIKTVVEIFYKNGFELISKFNENGEVLRTIDHEKVAAIRLKLDSPVSAYFFNPQTRLKVDLLFDFPFSAQEVAARAMPIKIKSHVIQVASREDLIRLKEIAYADRKSVLDVQDLEFLRRSTNRRKI